MFFKDPIYYGQDQAREEKDTLNANGYIEYTGRKRNRLCLVLDCLIPHDFSSKTSDLINLQHYVIKEKKLSEKEAVIIFADIVRIVESLHKVIFFLFSFLCLHRFCSLFTLSSSYITSYQTLFSVNFLCKSLESLIFKI